MIAAHGHKRECWRYLGSFGGQGQGKSVLGVTVCACVYLFDACLSIFVYACSDVYIITGCSVVLNQT